MSSYGYKDDFEMLYLRHDYLTKKKLDGEYVKEYAPIVHTTAKIMYSKLHPIFNQVGFHEEDIISITNIYMLGYMSLYSLRNNQKAKKKFSKKYEEIFKKKPTYEELYKKDKNNLINFLRQRLQHCATICTRKARNIIVGINKRGLFAETANTIQTNNENILYNYKKFGYRKITKREFKTAKMQAKTLNTSKIVDVNGYPIIKIQILNNGIGPEDYSLLFRERKDSYHQNPELMLMDSEDKLMLNVYKERFGQMGDMAKKNILKRFVNENKKNKALKEELALARKMISSPLKYEEKISDWVERIREGKS